MATGGTLVGEQPKPRMVIFGLEDHDRKEELSKLAPTTRHLSSAAPLARQPLRQSDWDVVVTDSAPWAEEHLFVVAVGPVSEYGRIGDASEAAEVRAEMFGVTHATVFKVPEGLPKSIRALVISDVLPVVEANAREGAGNNTLRLRAVHRASGHTLLNVDTSSVSYTPFLETDDGKVLAGSIRRSTRSPSELWFLPDGCDPVAWTAVALEHWQSVDPSRFPAGPAWADRSEWQSEPEARAVEALAQHDVQAEEVARAMEAERLTLHRELALQRDATDRRERGLLNLQAEPLVSVVTDCFVALGFTVEDVDKTVAAGGAKVEDLRVTCPQDDPDWIAIVEVKGYAGGAKSNDLLKLGGHFRIEFIKQKGQDADAVWYVVNQYLGSDPAARQQALSGHDAEVETFAESGGLVIDSVSLFRLWRSVWVGERTSAEARGLLRTATGRLEDAWQ
jgi:hypothetical protein